MMITKRHLLVGAATALSICGSSSWAKPDVSWSVRVFPDNSDYLEVAVSTEGMPPNTYLEPVGFTVRIYTGEGVPSVTKSYRRGWTAGPTHVVRTIAAVEPWSDLHFVVANRPLA